MLEKLELKFNSCVETLKSWTHKCHVYLYQKQTKLNLKIASYRMKWLTLKKDWKILVAHLKQ